MKHSAVRLRRLRSSGTVRRVIRETRLSAGDLMMPFFIIPGVRKKEPVRSMPGVERYSVDCFAREAAKLYRAGVKAVMLFGVTDKKDAQASASYDEKGIIQKAARAIKKEIPAMLISTDVCLCGYTSHGHCGLVRRGGVDNDATLEILAKIAVSHAAAGADLVAPSAMMDHQVRAIRAALDDNEYDRCGILSYAVKYASAFYGPFRDAALSAPRYGDRKAYQMDPANGNEAVREAGLDINEGADIIMVKPALAYLDVIYRVKERFGCPVAAYNVSGEYAMVKSAAQRGWIDEKNVALEILTSIKRAGASLIVTYHARDAVKWLT